MNIMPHGSIKFIETPFNTYSDSNKLKWITQSAQTEYFTGKTGITLTQPQYSVVGNGILRVNRLYDILKDFNYLFFSEDEYDGKYFYCFIKYIKEISTGVCDVYISIDDAQTWFFDGSQYKYLSRNPVVNYKCILPQNVRVKAGSNVQFKAVFSDDKHISQLANFYHAYAVSGITISIDGKLSVDSSVASGTQFVVLAKDKYDETTVSANITVT